MDLSTIITPALQQQVADIIILVLSAAAAFVSKALYTFIKTHTSANQFSILQQIADSAVHTAEQGALAGFVTDKKATASAIVNEGLKSAGITNLTAAQIDAAIEAAVHENFNDTTPVPVTVTDPVPAPPTDVPADVPADTTPVDVTLDPTTDTSPDVTTDTP